LKIFTFVAVTFRSKKALNSRQKKKIVGETRWRQRSVRSISRTFLETFFLTASHTTVVIVIEKALESGGEREEVFAASIRPTVGVKVLGRSVRLAKESVEN
jgi:hypothetical protein